MAAKLSGMASTLNEEKLIQEKASPKQISQPVDAGLGQTHEDYEKGIGTAVSADNEEDLVESPDLIC